MKTSLSRALVAASDLGVPFLDPAELQTFFERMLDYFARERDLRVVIVYSNVVRTLARKFYERNGYTVKKTSNVFEKRL